MPDEIEAKRDELEAQFRASASEMIALSERVEGLPAGFYASLDVDGDEADAPE